MNRIYIATIVIEANPKNKQNRLVPVRVKKDLYPFILDDLTMRLPVDIEEHVIRKLLKYKQNSEWKSYIKDFSKYNISYKLSNIKFSSNIYERGREIESNDFQNGSG